jgi:3-oxoacyl-[acyl-carrier-protein] synthase-3
MTMNTAVYSDGAAAAVVTRDAPGRRWLTTELVTDGRYADFLRMEAGGSAQPFGAGNDAADLRVRGPGDRLEEFFAGDITRMLEFVALIRERNTAVVESACKRAGLSLGDLTRLIHLHDNVKQFAELAHGLGLSLEQTNVRLAASFGHVGCADQLLSLRSHLDAGDLSSGDIVALTSTGSGMHWACTLLEV